MADWDIDKYKVNSESEEQWILRHDFMERWKNEIPEDRLVCLAQVFINVEFFGCRYPLLVMQQVAELSKEVAFEYRKKKKSKLQRTFVSASDAAEDRAKGSKRSYGTEQTPKIKSKKIMFVQAGHEENQYIKPVSSQNQPRKDERPLENLPQFRHEKNIVRNNFRFNDNLICNRFGNLVLHDNQAVAGYIGKLISSCDICKVSKKWIYGEEGDNITCVYVVNNIEVATGSGENQKIAKENTATLAWKTLQKECYSIITLQSYVSKEDKKISIQDVDRSKTSIENALDVKVESAIASRMMQLMGWKGGALGASANGISEPIAPNLKKQIRRAGIGSSSSDSVSIKNAVRKTMLEFKKSQSTDYDLVFANDFKKEERAAMHITAVHLGLKSKSYGKGVDRYLVISKHVKPAQLVQSLLDSGGSNEKYKLIKPTG
ncbi:uncharacterized protein LOC143911372 [Arctopsyche grandis]|uniref:uncharacterized protein LOC143911372 n=1 Tax=Arctopsyche grandis TaxID=121162 RepID=UPI00406D7DD0